MYRLTLVLLTCFSFFSHVQAAEFSLFSTDSERTQSSNASTESDALAPAPVIGKQVSTSIELKQANAGDSLSFQTPTGETLHINIERRIHHPNGDVSLTGYLDGSNYSATITRGESGTFATINSPDGQYKIEMHEGKEWFSSPDDRRNMIVPPFGNDAIAPPQQKNKPLQKSSIDSLSAAAAPPTSSTIIANIDVLVLYTPEFENGLGGAAAQTRINNLFSISNQAYIDSGLFIEIHPVHIEQIAASNTASDITALDALRLGTGIFSTVENLRASKGADVVMFLQKYTPQHNGCGLSYLLGGNGGGSLQGGEDYAYGIVQDGSYPDPNGGNFFHYCYDTTLAHELGHTFGFAHDRNNAGISGIFPYSYGHDNPGSFATIMSYDTPKFDLFSSPNLSSCNGQPCGIAEGNANSADNVKSGNLVRFDLVDFYPHIFPAAAGPLPGDINNSDSVTITDVVYIVNVVFGSNPDVTGANCDGLGAIDIRDVVCAIDAALNYY